MFGGAIASSICVDVKEKRTEKATSFSFSIVSNNTIPDFLLYYSVKQFFDNGGQHCIVISVGDGATKAFPKENFLRALNVLKNEPEITLLVIPDLYSPLFAKYATAKGMDPLQQIAEVTDEALAACSEQLNCFWLGDVPYEDAPADVNIDLAKKFVLTLLATDDSKSFGAIYYPFLQTQDSAVLDWSIIQIRQHQILSASGKKQDGLKENSALDEKTWQAKFPDLYHQLEQYLRAKLKINVPASGTMAGVICQVDSVRGVWKAPANIPLLAVSRPCIDIDQAALSEVASYPQGAINPITDIDGRGLVAMGARTLAPQASEWRYISVTRTTRWISEAVQMSLMSFVFESNTIDTWRSIEQMIEGFLTSLWQQGALAGESPEHAFFVRVGEGESMTREDINQNRLIVNFGIALLKPAEFLVIRLEVPTSH